MNNNLYKSFVVSFLGENYPNILNEIQKNYIQDVSEVQNVLNYFCEYFHVTPEQLQVVKTGKYLNYRYKFIGCVIYLFQPSRLTHRENLNKTIASEIKIAIGLNSANLNSSVKAVTNLYIYKEFRADIIHFCSTYKLLK